MAEDVRGMVEKARTAQAAIAEWTQAQVDALIAAVGWAVYRAEHGPRTGSKQRGSWNRWTSA